MNLVNIPLPRIFMVAAFTNNDSFFWQLELLEELHCRSMPFKCFNQAGQLTAHERLNPGEKHYECKQCGKCLSDAGSLKRHNRVHTGEKPYECKQCDKCFSAPGNLRSHERVYMGKSVMNVHSVESVLSK